jgi:PBP1b-binding outer membrane lipoprotein LpoB
MKGLATLISALIIIAIITSCSGDDMATKSENTDVSSTETTRKK